MALPPSLTVVPPADLEVPAVDAAFTAPDVCDTCGSTDLSPWLPLLHLPLGTVEP